MSTYQKVIVIGRLGRDPEVRYLQNGTAVCNLNLATDEGYKDQQGQKQERTEWHKIQAWGKQAENCAQYLAKGRACLVEGKLQTRKCKDQQGNDRYTTEIRADRVVFLGGGQPQQTQQQPQSQQQSANPPGPDQSWQSDDAPFALALIPIAGLLTGLVQSGLIL